MTPVVKRDSETRLGWGEIGLVAEVDFFRLPAYSHRIIVRCPRGLCLTSSIVEVVWQERSRLSSRSWSDGSFSYARSPQRTMPGQAPHLPRQPRRDRVMLSRAGRYSTEKAFATTAMEKMGTWTSGLNWLR